NFTRLDAADDARVDGLQGELAASRARFDALVLVAERGLRAAAEVRGVAAEHAVAAGGATPTAAPEAADEPDVVEPEPTAAPETVVTAETAAPPTAKQRSFLAFELPSDRFE